MKARAISISASAVELIGAPDGASCTESLEVGSDGAAVGGGT